MIFFAAKNTSQVRPHYEILHKKCFSIISYTSDILNICDLIQSHICIYFFHFKSSIYLQIKWLFQTLCLSFREKLLIHVSGLSYKLHTITVHNQSIQQWHSHSKKTNPGGPKLPALNNPREAKGMNPVLNLSCRRTNY